MTEGGRSFANSRRVSCAERPNRLKNLGYTPDYSSGGRIQR